jgi:hypothetical protein
MALNQLAMYQSFRGVAVASPHVFPCRAVMISMIAVAFFRDQWPPARQQSLRVPYYKAWN